MDPVAGAGVIVDRRGEHSVWQETPVRLFLAALVPLAIAAPLRALAFADASPVTVLFLGPALEESLKLSGVILVLTVASLALRGGRDPALVLRYWLFLAPWIVGGLYGMMEGIVGYPGQGGLDFTLRELAHATFVALSLGGALRIWRLLDAPLFGIGFGFAAGFSAHLWFNALAFLSDYVDVSFVDQVAYLAIVLVLTLVVLASEVRREPASAEARAFLPSRGRSLHP